MSIQKFSWRTHLCTGAVTCFVISFEFSVLSSSCIYIHTHRKIQTPQLHCSSTLFTYSDVLSGKMLFLRIMNCNNSNFAGDCLMHRRLPWGLLSEGFVHVSFRDYSKLVNVCSSISSVSSPWSGDFVLLTFFERQPRWFPLRRNGTAMGTELCILRATYYVLTT